MTRPYHFGCLLLDKNHWPPDCPTVKRDAEPIITAMSNVNVANDVTGVMVSVTKHCPTCTCPRVYKSNADKQRAYRERKKRV